MIPHLKFVALEVFFSQVKRRFLNKKTLIHYDSIYRPILLMKEIMMNCDTPTVVARSPSIVSFGICYYYYYDYDYYHVLAHILRIAKQPPKQPTSQQNFISFCLS